MKTKLAVCVVALFPCAAAGILFHFHPNVFASTLDEPVALLSGLVFLVFLLALPSRFVVDVLEEIFSDDAEHWEIPMVIIGVVSTLVVSFVVTGDFRDRLQKVRSTNEQHIQEIIATVKTTKCANGSSDLGSISCDPDSQRKPSRPFVVLKCKSFTGTIGVRPDVGQIYDWSIGDIDTSEDVRRPQAADFSMVRSVVLIADKWEKTGRMVELDSGSAPEMVQHVGFFVIDLRTHRLVWESSEDLVGGKAPEEYKGGGPGADVYVDCVKGSEVAEHAIENELKSIPWESGRDDGLH